MKTAIIKNHLPLLLGLSLLTQAPSGRAQTTIWSDNFNIPDTTSLDGSDQTGRHTGLLATNVVARSGGIELTITNDMLNLLKAGNSNDGRMRFAAATNTSGRWDWSSGAAGAAITASGGMQIDFDWTADENTSGDWISYNVGITPNSDTSLRVINAGTDYGILLQDDGGFQSFTNGTAVSSGGAGTFDVTSLSRHVTLDYAFTSWADGSPVTVTAYVNGNLITSQTFKWNGNSGIQNMEISSYAAHSAIDNFSVQTFAPPPYITVSAASDAPATVYAGRTVNFIGAVAGTLPITNQWMVDKGSGFVKVSASATNATLTLAGAQVSDSGTYELFSSNAAGSANSDPLALTVVSAPSTTSLNVQFTGSWLGSGNAPAQTAAGVIGNDGDTWNPISNPTGGTAPAGLAVGTNISLVDVSDIGTSVTLDYVGDYIFNGWAFGYESSDPFVVAGSSVENLMAGYMGSVSQGSSADTNTVTLHHLAPGSYDLYVYASGRSDGQTRINVFAANGSTAVCGPNSGNSTLTAGANYVHLTPTVASDGLLHLSYYGTVDAGQALMNGFQVNGPVTLPTLFLSSDTTSDSPATNYAGRTLTLTAGFGGYPTPALQWKINTGSGFVNVSSSATNSSLILSNAQPSASGSYALFASNVVGTSNSTPVNLTVLPLPTANFGINVNVQFIGTSRGTGFADTQTGPAVIGNAGDFWNPVSNPNPVAADTTPIYGNGLILSDASDIGTSFTLDYTGSADLNSGAGNPFYGSGSPAAFLLESSLTAENSGNATVTLHGVPMGTYNLYLYASAGTAGQSAVSQFTANGDTASAGPNSGNNALAAGANYVLITPVVSGNGLLNISFNGAATGLGILNGFQLSGPGAYNLFVNLGMQQNGSQITLTWPNGTLLETTNLLGPWTTNAAASPFTFTPSPTQAQKYYKVQVR
jgi:hypothetical protein